MKPSSPQKKKGSRPNGILAVDLFCGAGGLTCGLLDAGIPVVQGYDIDASCRFAYEYNNPGARFIHKSVADLEKDDLREAFASAKFRILAGCAPYQPFSKYTQGQNMRKDAKWGLLHEFSRLVKTFLSEIVSMERVVVFSQVGKMIGNAVPVHLGKVIGLSILKHLRLMLPHPALH